MQEYGVSQGREVRDSFEDPMTYYLSILTIDAFVLAANPRR
jgi:hypothetical protein